MATPTEPMLGLHCRAGFTLAVSRGYTPVVAHWLLVAVASLVEEPGLSGTGLQ